MKEGQLLKALNPSDFDDFELIPVIREALGVKFKHDAFISVLKNSRTGGLRAIRANKKAVELLTKYGTVFYGFYSKEQNSLGLQAHDNGNIFLKNNMLSGIKKLLNNFNPDNQKVEVYKVFETDSEFKKIHNVDILLVPYDEAHFWINNETLGNFKRKHRLERVVNVTSGKVNE